MGGSRAVRQMAALCRHKGSAPFGSGVINWSKAPVREKQIEALAGYLRAALETKMPRADRNCLKET